MDGLDSTNSFTLVKWSWLKLSLSIPKCFSTDSAKRSAFSWFVLAVFEPSLSVGYGLRLGLTKFLSLHQDLDGLFSKLMELQNFSQLVVDFKVNLVLISFCNLLMVDLIVGSLLVAYSRLSLRFSLMISNASLLMGGLLLVRLYAFGVDMSAAAMMMGIMASAYLSRSWGCGYR